MISVIICSKNNKLLNIAIESIKQTIGIDHEFIIYDNSNENKGICEVYNICAKRSKYKFLCFVHEDVYFDSYNWGIKLIEKITSENNIGVIGVAGTGYVPRNFISWGDNVDFDRCDYWQFSKSLNNFEHYIKNPNNEHFSNVILLDGVFLFLNKSVWENIKFDDKTFSGFHLYDSDFCFNASLKYINYVYYGLKIYHQSSGNSFSKDYCESLIKFKKKWKNHTPQIIRTNKKVSFLYKYKKEYYNSHELLNRFKYNFGNFSSYFLVLKNCNLIVVFLFIFGVVLKKIKIRLFN